MAGAGTTEGRLASGVGGGKGTSGKVCTDGRKTKGWGELVRWWVVRRGREREGRVEGRAGSGLVEDARKGYGK